MGSEKNAVDSVAASSGCEYHDLDISCSITRKAHAPPLKGWTLSAGEKRRHAVKSELLDIVEHVFPVAHGGSPVMAH
ncbi:hypothetical protein QE152_g33696 [Popillia japonica]|uniref:Uncharacterized protein n=1 Tax=Popillia japonica TaxID=7064 RepID=A0AAW1IVY5_POPJA